MEAAIDKTAEFYKYSKKYIHYYSKEIPSLIKGIFEKNKIRNIADLGSGDGSILYALLKKGYLDDTQDIVAVDISNERISRVKEISGKIRAIAADICDLHMIDSMTLDLVISSQVIEHVPDEKRLINEIYRVLKPNGLFYLSTVYKRWYGWYFYRNNGRWILDPTHLREYKNENELLDKLEGCKFTLLENKKSLHWFPITDFIFKRIGMRSCVYNNKFARFLRNVKIPILGYYNWELVFKRGDERAAKESVSVCIPVYNGARTITETIQSILAQTFRDFELVIVDNASTDSTVEVVKAIADERIRLYINEENLGTGGNLEECRRKARGDILFYIAADDVADIHAVEKVYDAFQISDEIGIVSRPYIWFDESAAKPARATKQFKVNQLISINDPYEKVRDVIALSDQISGIGFRKRYMNFSFGPELFIEMATLVTHMLKDCKAVVLKDNIIAVRMQYSGTTTPATYLKSPMLTWYNLINRAYCEDKFRKLRRYLIREFIATNYIGLVQIKNFGSYKALFREIYYLIKLRWPNLFNLKFWFFCIGTTIVPRFILRRIVVLYKNRINNIFLKGIKPLSIWEKTQKIGG